MIPVLLAAFLAVPGRAVLPAFEAAQASFLRGSANDGVHEALGDTIALPVTPYARYFLANIDQFQFYQALCKQSGHVGPLHRCSFYRDKAASKKLGDMMAMGSSRPWPEALEAATGTRQMDATAVLEHFPPLKVWLDEQNKGQTVGW